MRWLWIDRILTFEPGQRMVAIKNVSLAEDHLHDHFAADETHAAQPIMPATLMIEGMAQTAGILVGTAREFREKVILAKIQSAVFEADVEPGDAVIYDAQLVRIDDTGAQTSGTISRSSPTAAGPGERLAIGQVDLMFSHLDRNRAGIAFPEHNFVFSDNFRTILRSAGIPALDALADANA